MKNIASLIINIINELNYNKIYAGRTNIQKVAFLVFKEEEKDLYFKPYYYGPYSETIQATIQSLFYKRYIFFHNNIIGYKTKKIDYLSDDYKELVSLTIKFLKENNLLSTKLISEFVKIYYFYYKNLNKNNDEIVNIIKNVSKFIWPEIARKSEDELKKGIEMSFEYTNLKKRFVL